MSEPAYVIAQIDTKDLPRYRTEYGKQVAQLIVEHGGELLVGTAETQTLEGTWAGNWTVVIRFPSRAAALGWYESAEYAPLRRARVEVLTGGGNLVLVPGRR